MSARARMLLWGLPALAYAAFWLWYTPLGGPLRAAEIERFVAAMTDRGRAPERIAQFRRFMESDSGRPFLMVNVTDMADAPPELPATGPGASADELLGHYMEHMFPELFKRACHPVFIGTAVFDSVDIVGIDGAESWSRAVLMRYRSRRDLMEIVAHPATAGRHEYKVAALDKTIAYPVEAELLLSDLRIVVGLALLALIGVVDALARARVGAGTRHAGPP